MTDPAVDALHEFVQEYTSLLEAYVRAPAEALRERVYQLGHEAIARGLGVLDLTAIHRELLLGLLARHPQDSTPVATRASELFLELMVPFEMTHRGYKETIHKLVAANEALRVSEAKNLALLNAIPDAMFRIGRDGTYLDFKGGKNNAGILVSPDEAVGKKVRHVLPADLAAQVMAHVERALHTDTIQVFEYQLILDNQQHDFEVRLAVSGKREVLGIVRDITERKRAEEEHAKLIGEQAARAEAQAAQERISNILESIADGFVALDDQWRFVYVNRQAERLLRTPRADLLRRSIWEVFPGAVASAFDREFHRAVAEQVTVHLKAFYPPLRTWFETHAYPSRDGLSIYFRDVTEQRHHERARLGLARIAQQIAATSDIEQALSMAVGELVASFEVAIACVWLWDEAEQALLLRASAGLPTGTANVPSRLAIGESDIGQVAATRQPLWSNALEREPWSGGLEEARQAGLIAFAAFPLLAGDRLLGVVGLSSRRPFDEDDLTALATLADQLAVAIEKSRLLAEVQAALALRQEFIDAAAHELRTPVTILKGYASVLRRVQDPASPTFAKALKALELSANRVARLARELIEADALARGTLSLRQQRFDLADLAQQIVTAVAVEHPDHHFDLRTAPAIVTADQEWIGEVIRHLVDNAVKYQPQGGTVAVSVGAHARQAVLTVQDRGPGIPRERQAHMFEPMYEPIPAGQIGYVGVVGLGLMISKRLVELHGGRIWFESAPGRGSAFHFALPLAPPGNGHRSATEQGA